jgi:hypothetical protein
MVPIVVFLETAAVKFLNVRTHFLKNVFLVLAEDVSSSCSGLTTHSPCSESVQNTRLLAKGESFSLKHCTYVIIILAEVSTPVSKAYPYGQKLSST